jgi:hypothetical protein
MAPFAGEDFGAGEKSLPQSHTPGIVVARCGQRDHGKTQFECLEADIGSIQVNPLLSERLDCPVDRSRAVAL